MAQPSRPTSSTETPPSTANSTIAPPGTSFQTAQPTDPNAITIQRSQQYEALKHNIALFGIIACPALILLPPRKLDLYTFSLAGGFALSANQLLQNYWAPRNSHAPNYAPELLKSTEKSLPTERAQQVHEQIARIREQQGRENWKETRLREDGERLAQGEGYGDLIRDYARDAFGIAKRREGGETVVEKPGEEGKK